MHVPAFLFASPGLIVSIVITSAIAAEQKLPTPEFLRRCKEINITELKEARQDMRAVPKNENGQITGVKVFAIAPCSTADMIGLKDDDVVQKINDKEIKSVEALIQGLGSFRNAKLQSVSGLHNNGERFSLPFDKVEFPPPYTTFVPRESKGARSTSPRELEAGPKGKIPAGTLPFTVKEAEKELKRARKTDPRGLAVIDALMTLSVLRTMAGNNDKAEALVSEAEQIQKKYHPGDVKKLAEIYSRQAGLAFQKRKYPLAEQLWQKAIAIHEKADGASTIQTGALFIGLSAVLSAQEKHSEAEAALQKAVAIYERTMDPDTSPEAKRIDENYEQIREKGIVAGVEFGKHPSQTQLASSLFLLGKHYLDRQQFAEAKPVLERALKKYEDAFGEESTALLPVIGAYATVLEKTGNTEAAKQARTREMHLADLKVQKEQAQAKQISGQSPNAPSAAKPSEMKKQESARRSPRELVVFQKMRTIAVPDPKVRLITGVKIFELDKGGFWTGVGLKEGDILRGTESERISDLKDVGRILGDVAEGKVRSLIVERDGRETSIKIDPSTHHWKDLQRKLQEDADRVLSGAR